MCIKLCALNIILYNFILAFSITYVNVNTEHTFCSFHLSYPCIYETLNNPNLGLVDFFQESMYIDKKGEIAAKITTHNEDYFTIAGYASLRGVNIDTAKANMLGRKAAKLPREYGYDIGKVTDSRFGKVNSYHLVILKNIFEFVA